MARDGAELGLPRAARPRLLLLPRPARSRSAEEREADWACHAADPHEHRAMASALEL